MADDSRLSSVIDEEGKLFGLINVIDALVVLLVIAVVVAGLALVVPSGSTAETRYVTVDLDTQPAFKADQITAGDRWNVEGSSSDLRITNVFAAPRTDGTRDVVIRAAVNGTAIDPTATTTNTSTIQFAGSPLRYGEKLEIETNQYVVAGTVTDINTDEQFGVPSTRTLTVQISGISETRADRLREGVTEILGNTETATVTNVNRQPTTTEADTPTERYDVTLTMNANIRELEDGTVVFRGQRLRFDQDITFDLGGTIVKGTVVDIA